MPENEEKECKACGYALAGVGVLVSLIFLYMAVDVFTGGKISTLISRADVEAE